MKSVAGMALSTYEKALLGAGATCAALAQRAAAQLAPGEPVEPLV